MTELFFFDANGNPIINMYQWDVNQRIYIHDWDSQFAPTIHFCNKKSNEAIAVIGSMSNGIVSAAIPNSLLQEPYSIIVYVYTGNGSGSFNTIVKSEIPVRARVKPPEYCYEDNTGGSITVQIDERISAVISELEDARVGSDGTVYESLGAAIRAKANSSGQSGSFDGNVSPDKIDTSGAEEGQVLTVSDGRAEWVAPKGCDSENTSDYNDLDNLPTINGKEIKGGISLEDIGAMPADTEIPESVDAEDIKNMGFALHDLGIENANVGQAVGIAAIENGSPTKYVAIDLPTGGGFSEADIKNYLDENEYATKDDIPETLSDLTEDDEHQLVSDQEKTAWNSAAEKTSVIGKSMDERKIVIIGDSLSVADDPVNRPNPYAPMIEAATGVEFSVDAISGTSIARNEHGSNPFVDRIPNLPTDADGVVFFGCYNDAYYTQMGEQGSTDVTTFWGAVKWSALTLKQMYPGKPVIFVLPQQNKDAHLNLVEDPHAALHALTATSTTNNRQLLVQCIKEVAESTDCYVIDAWNLSGITGKNPEYYLDGLHLSKAGNEKLAKFLQGWLELYFGANRTYFVLGSGGNSGSDTPTQEWVDVTGTLITNTALAQATDSTPGMPKTANGGYVVTDYISVTSGATIRYEGHAVGGWAKRSYYKEDKSLLDADYSDAEATGIGGIFEVENEIVPDGAAYIVVAGNTTSGRRIPKVEVLRNIGGTDTPGNQATGLTDALKSALLDCFSHVAWTDEHGQEYIDALKSALGIDKTPEDSGDTPEEPAEPIDTSPKIARVGAGLDANGTCVTNTATPDACYTDFYTVDPTDQSITIFYSNPDAKTFGGYNRLQWFNGDELARTRAFNSTMMNSELTDTVSGEMFRMTLHKDHIDGCYVYGAQTGNVYFAGTQTKYYGFRNISEYQGE